MCSVNLGDIRAQKCNKPDISSQGTSNVLEERPKQTVGRISCDKFHRETPKNDYEQSL